MIEQSLRLPATAQVHRADRQVSRTKMSALLTALKTLGDLHGSTDVERFVLPGVAQLGD